ncbi:hypothetical protein ONZ45_g6169 [Pleurotus djamor]|nr:hypothetical protein ONZ45_g6169 [Pleurotus djamor]
MSGEEFDTLFGELFGDTLDDTENHNPSVVANANEKLDDTTDGAEQDDHLLTLTNEFAVPHVPPQDWLFSVATPQESGVDQTLSLPTSGWPDTFSFRHAAVPNDPPGPPDDAQAGISQETATTECASTTNTSKASAPAVKRKNKCRRDDEIEDASSDQPSTSVAPPAKKVVRRRGRPRKNQDTDPQPSTTATVAPPSASITDASVNRATLGPSGGDLLPSTERPTSSARPPQHNAHPTTSASSFQPPLSGTGVPATTRPMASSSYPSRGAMNGGISHPMNGTGMFHYVTPSPLPLAGIPSDRPMLYKKLAERLPGFNPVIFEQNLALFGETAIDVFRDNPLLLIRPALPSAAQLLAYGKGVVPQPPARVHNFNKTPSAVLPRPAISRPIGGFRTQPRSYVPSPLGRVPPTCATPPSYVAYPAFAAQWQDRASVGVSDQHNIRAQGNFLTPIQPPIPQAGSPYPSDHLYQPIAGPSRPTFTRPSQDNLQLARPSPSPNVPSVIGLPFGSQTTATNMAAILPASPHAPPTALDWQNRPYSFPVEFAPVRTLGGRPN